MRKLKRANEKIPYISKRTGETLPGVTTILNILNKPALIHWAYGQGKKGVPLYESRDNASDIGSIAHYFIECFVNDEEPELDDKFPPKFVLTAGEMFRMFLQYWNSRKAVLIASEIPLIDEDEGYGGTIDLLVECDSTYKKGNSEFTHNLKAPTVRVNELWDLKTSKDIWSEQWIQVSAYCKMVNKLMPERLTQGRLTPRIINITKTLNFQSPDITEETQAAALDVWVNLYKIYKPLWQIRNVKNA